MFDICQYSRFFFFSQTDLIIEVSHIKQLEWPDPSVIVFFITAKLAAKFHFLKLVV